MELNFEDCGSICKPPLFYITRSISNGIPTQDCFEAAISNADDRVKIAVERLGYLYYVVITSSGIPLFLLCGYNKSLDRLAKEADEEDERLKEEGEEGPPAAAENEAQNASNQNRIGAASEGEADERSPVQINISQLNSPQNNNQQK